jgi:hypothetical protein
VITTRTFQPMLAALNLQISHLTKLLVTWRKRWGVPPCNATVNGTLDKSRFEFIFSAL